MKGQIHNLVYSVWFGRSWFSGESQRHTSIKKKKTPRFSFPFSRPRKLKSPSSPNGEIPPVCFSGKYSAGKITICRPAINERWFRQKTPIGCSITRWSTIFRSRMRISLLRILRSIGHYKHWIALLQMSGTVIWKSISFFRFI